MFRNLGYKLYEGLYIGVTGKTGSSVFLNNDVLDIIFKLILGGRGIFNCTSSFNFIG